MRTVLHIIFRKSVIKLCLIVLLVVFFVNESFSQTYNLAPYSGSYNYSLHSVPGLLGLNRYEISVKGNYSGGGMYNPPPTITGYLYVSSFTFNNTYTHSVIRRNVDIIEDKMVIYYDPDTSCPNHNMPCNILGHARLVPDWATRVTYGHTTIYR